MARLPKRTRRANGEGSFWREGKSYRWRKQYIDPLTGKPDTANCSAQTQVELNRKIAEFKKSLEQDTGDFKTLTLNQWLERWLETKKLNKKAKTYRNYEGICRIHIQPVLGEYLIQKIRKEHVQSLFNKLSKDFAPTTVASVKRIFRIAMNDAMDEGIISTNPVLRTQTPTVRRHLPVALEQSDMLKMFQLAYTGEFLPPLKPQQVSSKYLRHQYFVSLCVSMATAMRKNELFALTWNRVQGNILRVDRSIESDGNKQELSTPKTDSSVRYVAIPNSIATLLTEWKKEQDAYASMLEGHYDNPLGLVFTNSVGNFVSPNNLYKRWWNPLRQAVGLPDFKWHNLRSACLSYFASHGTDMRTVGQLAGHSDVRTTMAYYIGITTSQEQQRLAVAEEWAKAVLPKPTNE